MRHWRGLLVTKLCFSEYDRAISHSDLTAAVDTCTRPVQDQTSQPSSMDGGGPQSPALAENYGNEWLLEEGKSVFLKNMTHGRLSVVQ